MDVIRELGELAFASRLRRLAERLHRDATRLYQEHDLEFEARWFPLVYLLRRGDSMPLTKAARLLGVTHPAVHQLAGELTKRGLLRSDRDDGDVRRRLLVLTSEGRSLSDRLAPLWDDIANATREVVASSAPDLLSELERIERSLDESSIYDRVRRRAKAREFARIEILDYTPRLKPHFRRLNLEWLQKEFAVEPHDERILSDPNGQILRPGGAIFFARLDGLIVGTCALLRIDATTFELTKLAVTEPARGRQVGKRLVLAAIARAREEGAHHLRLDTSPRLTAANRLYQQLGFVDASTGDGATRYQRPTLSMSLTLAADQKRRPRKRLAP